MLGEDCRPAQWVLKLSFVIAIHDDQSTVAHLTDGRRSGLEDFDHQNPGIRQQDNQVGSLAADVKHRLVPNGHVIVETVAERRREPCDTGRDVATGAEILRYEKGHVSPDRR